ncbi:MAG: restriction endonuclease [Actinobacteria bacterium]|nr:restriction endonuclease [Actinomycetota bacterium]
MTRQSSAKTLLKGLSFVSQGIYSPAMTIGNFEYYFVPILAALKKNGKTHRRANMEDVSKAEALTPEELALTNSKGTNVFRSRVHWAQAFLAQAGAVSRPQRGYLEITDRGLKLLDENPQGFKAKKFREFPDYADAWGGKRKHSDHDEVVNEPDLDTTPQEKIESAIDELEDAVATDIVQRVRNLSPKFLEIVVLQLLQAMGYGASESSIEHVGGPGDEGVDGVIHQDALGLQRIYVQAKRYKAENTIGRPDIQKFVGALSGLGANGGVFITTSTFSNDARDYASKNLSARVVLIDGAEFGKLMVRHGIGVQKRRTYSIVDIDEDYFED